MRPGGFFCLLGTVSASFLFLAGTARGRVAHQGAAARRGQKPFLFLRKKKRFLTPKKKLGPVSVRFGVENGGLQLSYDIGAPSRPLRPALMEQGQADALTIRRLRLPLSGPGWWGASLAAEREICVEFDDPGALSHSAARVAQPGGCRIEPHPLPCSTMTWP